MTHKIIVADDSQTIQKVIKITFAQHDVELISCLNEKELMDKLDESIDLILLDFSLSETKTGYELGKIISDKFSQIPLMGLLGTFDTINDDHFRSSGYSDKVIKPFETEKFINKCERLLESTDESLDIEEDDMTEELSDWSVESSASLPDEEILDESDGQFEEMSIDNKNDDANELSQELGGWGLDGPDLELNDVTKFYDEFPPVIENNEQIVTKFLSAETLVSDEDLESFESENEEQESENEEYKLESDELEYGAKILEEENIQEDPIVDEVQSTDEDNFWAVDTDVSDVSLSEENEEASIEEEQALAPESENEQAQEIEIEEDNITYLPKNIELDIKAELTPIVEKLVKKYCEENVEKIIWEIVPDLAENLIRKELKRISSTVLSSVNN